MEQSFFYQAYNGKSMNTFIGDFTKNKTDAQKPVAKLIERKSETMPFDGQLAELNKLNELRSYFVFKAGSQPHNFHQSSRIIPSAAKIFGKFLTTRATIEFLRRMIKPKFR